MLESSVSKPCLQSEEKVEKLNRLSVFADLSALFAEKLWQEQDNRQIRQLITNIVTAIALHLDDDFSFRCGNFLVQLDSDNKEHIFIDQNRRELIQVTALPKKSGPGMQILRAPYRAQKNRTAFF